MSNMEESRGIEVIDLMGDSDDNIIVITSKPKEETKKPITKINMPALPQVIPIEITKEPNLWKKKNKTKNTSH